jgi:molecular chaperone HscB
MNYFEFYGIPVSFMPDEAALKTLFFQKSREFHPDFFTNASEEEKQFALNQTSINNIAYKTITDPEARTKYILELEGILIDGQKEALPQDFLFEMMELNEELEGYQESNNKPEIDDIRREIESMIKNIDKENQPIYQNYPKNKEQLPTLKENYLKSKYLARILTRVTVSTPPQEL